MQTTIDVVLPIFGLIAAGFLFGRTRLFGPEATRGMTNFVFYLAIPALLFRAVQRGLESGALDLSIVLAYFPTTLAVMVAGMLAGRYVFRLDLRERALMGMGCGFGNTVMLGVPLVVQTWGEEGMVPMVMILTFHPVVLISFITVILEVGGHRGGRLSVVWAAAKGAVRNPIVMSILVGIAFGFSGLPMPSAGARFLEFLAQAAAPCALFTLGASLVGQRIVGELPASLAVVLVKLFVHPLAVWLVASQLFALPPLWVAVATLTAALPCGANLFILARQYQVFLRRAMACVVMSTAASALTLAVLLPLLARLP